MDDLIKNVLAVHERNTARHGEMLTSLSTKHGDQVASAVWALHKQYRIMASDMLICLNGMPDMLRQPFIESHQASYGTLAILLLEALLGEGNDKTVSDVLDFLASMNEDANKLLAMARKENK